MQEAPLTRGAASSLLLAWHMLQEEAVPPEEAEPQLLPCLGPAGQVMNPVFLAARLPHLVIEKAELSAGSATLGDRAQGIIGEQRKDTEQKMTR